MYDYGAAQRNEFIICKQRITSFGGGVETAQPQVSAFCDETGAKSAKLGLFLEQVGSHETRTKELRCLIEYSPNN